MFLGLALAVGASQSRSGTPAPPDSEPHSFTLTAGNLSDVIFGYQPDFSTGSISRQPLDNNILDLFYLRTDLDEIDVQFSGSALSIMVGKVAVIDGTPLTVKVDWIENMGKTAASFEGVPITEGDHLVTWQ